LREQTVSVGVDHNAVMGFAGVDAGPYAARACSQLSERSDFRNS
jgi:hypothetical protein